MPEVIIVAGPNGAGKTSFANEFLALERERFVYVNADEIAREPTIANLEDAHRNLAAGREMLSRIDDTVLQRRDLMFETTLATLSYAPKIARWRQAGFTVSLIYLRLSNVEASIARVARRVAAGGHDIPTETIRKRFQKSREYLHLIYKPIVDEWYV